MDSRDNGSADGRGCGLQVLAAQGATFFFDQDADFVRGTSSTLRSEFIFGAPATATDGSLAAARDLYESLCTGAPAPLLAGAVYCCIMHSNPETP